MKIYIKIIIFICITSVLTIQNTSAEEKINPTLFFSRKNQKDFIRLALNKGLEDAFLTVTQWRRELIQDTVKQLF